MPTNAVRDDFRTVVKNSSYVGMYGLVATTSALMIMKVVQSKIIQGVWGLATRRLPLLKGTVNACFVAFTAEAVAKCISKYLENHDYSPTFCSTVRVATVLLITGGALILKLPFPFACSLPPLEAIYYGVVAAAKLYYAADRVQDKSYVKQVVGKDSLIFYYFCAFLFIQISALRARLALGGGVVACVVSATLLSRKIGRRISAQSSTRIIASFVIGLLSISMMLYAAKFLCSPCSSLRLGLMEALGCSVLGAGGAAIITAWEHSRRQPSSTMIDICDRSLRRRGGQLSLAYAAGYSLMVGAVTIVLLAVLGKGFSIVNHTPKIKGYLIVAVLGGLLTTLLSRIEFRRAEDHSFDWDFLIRNLIIFLIVVMIAPKASSLLSGFRIGYRQAAAIPFMGAFCQLLLGRFIEGE